MSSEFRNFLELSYEELEDLNLAAKDQRKKRVDAGKIQEERLKYLTDTPGIKAVTVVFSTSKAAAHARLRQEIPRQQLRQPDVRRLVDPRLYRAARERSPPRARLERLLLDARRHLRRGQVPRLR